MGEDDSASVKIPDFLLDAIDHDQLRTKREQQTIRRIEERLRAGEITVAEADEELVALALERFDHFSESTQAAVRERGQVLLHATPELVESRSAVAARYDAKSGNDEDAR